MKVVDANVLLYAVNTATGHHEAARAWLDRALSGRESIGFDWVVLLAFLRISTRREIFPRPLTVDQAMSTIDFWLGAGPSVVLATGPRHLAVMADLLRDAGTGGNLVNDAHLAALAVQHRATLVSFDRDMARFDGVVHELPTAG